jgi:demethylmenaquinone methyltransferase/2-methoxy-6-polyprenyl-1,4-benzoquinol methylase
MSPPSVAVREQHREQMFSKVWTEELNTVFAELAHYYDRANNVASFGLMNWMLSHFMSIIELHPNQRTLDVCGGTNAIGIALLKREPTLKVHAMDRSAAMQDVGRQRAAGLGFHIDSTIGDVHKLPFPDNHFDIVTLQFASRHLRIREVFSEIHRVLKPGGHFYHSDMLRPANSIVKKLYLLYLRACLSVTGLMFKSASSAYKVKQYFLDAIDMFYSAEELSGILRELNFCDVKEKTLIVGMIGFHRGVKPGLKK